jgi:hypothetical protein
MTEKYLRRLPAPRTSVDVERACRSLAAQPQQLSAYLLAIAPADYARLLGHSLSAPVLGALLRALAAGESSEAQVRPCRYRLSLPAA